MADLENKVDELVDALVKGVDEKVHTLVESQENLKKAQQEVLKGALEGMTNLKKLIEGVDQIKDYQGDHDQSNLEIHKAIQMKTQEVLSSVNGIPSEARNFAANYLSRVCSYLADIFPLPTTIIPIYTGIITASNEYLTGDPRDCDADYQILRWAAFAAALVYLTVVHYMRNGASVSRLNYARMLSANLLVFTIFVSLLNGLPPTECYTDPKWVMIAGAVLLLATYFAEILYHRGFCYEKCPSCWVKDPRAQPEGKLAVNGLETAEDPGARTSLMTGQAGDHTLKEQELAVSRTDNV